MKLTKTQWTWIGLLLIAGVLIYVYYRSKKKNAEKGVVKSNVRDLMIPLKQPIKAESGYTNSAQFPSYYNLRTRIDVEGKKKVFPFTIEKISEGVMELPNRRSLIDKDAKYKFVDVKEGDKVKIVALINLSYTVNHLAFNDDFLVTDKDNLLSYTQAVKNYKIV